MQSNKKWFGEALGLRHLAQIGVLCALGFSNGFAQEAFPSHRGTSEKNILSLYSDGNGVKNFGMNVVPIWDWNPISRWRADPSQTYGWYSVIGIGLIAAQSLLIGALLISRARRRSIEKTLVESEKRYRTAFMLSPDAINITRLRDGLYLNVNDGFTRTMGWTSKEAVGKTSVELNLWAHIEDRQRVVEAVTRDGFCKNMEADFVAKNGCIFTGLMSAKLMTINEEQCLLSVTRDITERKQFERKLAHEKALMDAIFDSIPDGIVYTNVDRKIVRINSAFESIFGFELEDLAGKTTSYFYDSQADYEMQGKIRFNAKAQTYLHPYEVKYRKKNGVVFQSETLGTTIKDSNNHVLGFIGVIRDITERKAVQDKMQLAASVFTHAREGITITDAQGTIVEVNNTFTQITGYSRDEVIGKNPRILSSGRQGKDFYQGMWKSLKENDYWYGEIWNRRKSGEIFIALLTISAVFDSEGVVKNYVALFSDISLQKAHENQLEHIAHYDALTNLPNRVLLADRLHQAMMQSLRRQKRIAIVYLDLDGFKAVNDRHGHHLGDRLLVDISNRMKLTLREGDTLARLGGDEFVAVFIDLQDTLDTVPMLTRLLNAASEPAQIDGITLQVSASVGVTFFPQDEEIGGEQLLRQADQAMYQAKVAGKNRYHIFDASHDTKVRLQIESLEHIRRALERHEFVMHYQPKVNMRTGELAGVEALIRWQHPDRGLLAPGSFLHLIEDDPLAVTLGEWVMDTVLTQIETWKTAGLLVAVSINVGARQLQQSDFLDKLRVILSSHASVSPSLLELEILETSALADVAKASLLIESCAELGVTFALDDFGTGYSSLTYLKRFRVGTLKIDQSFVRDMLDDADDLAILEGVIGLAAAFGRKVIAEGVETIEHGTALLNLGCEVAQGYGIARPMPAEQIPGWAASWQPDSAWVQSSP